MAKVGIDIIDTKRMEKSIKNENFKSKVFLPSEIEYCEKYKNNVERFAGMFACKEAVMKACQFAGQYFNNIEVLHNEVGAPLIKLNGVFAEKFDEKQLQVSISHITDVAVAIAILND